MKNTLSIMERLVVLLVLISPLQLLSQTDCSLGDDCIQPADTLQLITTTSPTLFQIDGCLSEANPEVIVSECNFGNKPTVWYKIYTDSLADKLEIWCETEASENCVMAVFSGDCDSLLIQNNGTPSIPQLCTEGLYMSFRLNPAIKSYYLAISDASPTLTDGEYELLIYTTEFKTTCDGNQVPNPAISNLVKNKINSGDQVNLGLQASAPFLSVEAYSSLNPYIEGANYHYYDNAGNVRDTLTNLSDTIQKIKYFYRSINSTNLCYSKLDTVEIEILPKEKVIVGGIVWGDNDGNCNYSGQLDSKYPNIGLQIVNSDNIIIDTTYTDQEGKYSFLVDEGNYTIWLLEENFTQNGVFFYGGTSCNLGSDPNNNTQNDNNGFFNGMTIQTNTIELILGQEPNGNENLTIDFGTFFDCGNTQNNPFAHPDCSFPASDPICNLKNLEQGCGIMFSVPNSTGPSPLCPNGIGEPTNTSWFGFVAGNGDYDIQFEFAGCTPGTGGEIGVQIGMLLSDSSQPDCRYGPAIICEANLISPPSYIIEGSVLTPGQKYLIWLDGFNGSVCGYQINILGEFIPYTPSIPTNIKLNGQQNPSTILVGSEVILEVSDEFDSYEDIQNHTYRWSLLGDSGNILDSWVTNPDNWETTSSNLTFLANQLGTYQICIDEIVDICGNLVMSDLCQQFVVTNLSMADQSISGISWHDHNGDGIYESTEQVLSNVSVSIIDKKTGMVPIDQITLDPILPILTDQNGMYTIQNILPGDYVISFSKPDTTWYYTRVDITGANSDANDIEDDSDVNPSSGNSHVITLELDENVAGINAGFFRVASITGLIWHDSNANGNFDDSVGSLLHGTTVTVIDLITGANPALDINGNPAQFQISPGGISDPFVFVGENGLAPGTYDLSISPPNGWFISELGGQNVFDPFTATLGEGPIELISDQSKTDVYGGIYANVTVGGIIFGDRNNNCMYNNNRDTVYKDVVLSLVDEIGEIIKLTQTDSSGYYVFENIKPGSYAVLVPIFNFNPNETLENLEACVFSFDPNNDIPLDNNGFNPPNEHYIITDPIELLCGGEPSGGGLVNNTIDIGLVENNLTMIEVGGKVWSDINSDCAYNSFYENLYSGVSISILDENGLFHGTTTTDTNGVYSFSVPEGRYIIQLDKENFASTGSLNNLEPCGDAVNPNNDVPNDNNGFWHPGQYVETDTIELIVDQEPGGNTNNTIDFGLDYECASGANNPFANLDCTTAFDNPICDLQLLVSGCSTNYDFANPGSPSPFCNGGSLTPFSISWFSFVAGYGDYDLEIQIHGCYPDSSGNAGGLVAALFNSDTENCWEENSLFCSETPTNDKITIPMSDLMIPGKKYILALDGFKGSICGYSINLLGNYQPYIVHDPFEIICNQAERCDSIEIQNSLTFKVNDILNTYDTIENVNYYWVVKNQFSDTIDSWSTNPDLITSDNQITYTFNDPGTYFMCLGEVGDVCNNVVPSDLCYEVYVNKPNYTLSGYAFIDTNLNGIFDVGELPLPNFKIIDPSSNMTYFTNDDGYYYFRVDQGLQTYEVEASYGLWDMASYTITTDILVDQTVIDFPFVAVSGPATSDAIVSSGLLRCNTFALLNVSVLNTSNRALKGTLEINFDPTTVSYEFDPQPTKITNTQYIYDFQDINPGLSFSPFIRIGIPPFFPMQDSMTFDIVIKDDEGNILDEMKYTDVIRCSYDPNDKRSWPDRPGDENHILAGEIIDYTIRFQNNGNDTAFYVEVVDVISPYLDPSTITLRESSHDMSVQIHEDTVFFIFDPIALVDSTTNFEASQGFVSFSIMATENIDAGELVQNKAAIIFDKNDPIITNSTLNTVVDILPCYHISNVINQDGNTLFGDDQGLNYQWIDCEDGTVAFESSASTFTPEFNGLYQIIIDGDNCQNVTDCYSFTLSSTDDWDKNTIRIYPNPTNGIVLIEDDYAYKSASFTNLLGQKIDLEVRNNQVDISILTSGIYLMKLNRNGQEIVKKVVKM